MTVDRIDAPPSAPGSAIEPRLNILALPSFTAILFGLTVFVILAAVLSSLLPDSKMWWPPLVLGVVLLTLRDFLRAPQRAAQRSGLQAADQRVTPLADALAKLGAQTSQRTPQLLVADQQAIWSFGTFRRRFIAVGQGMGAVLSQYIARPNAPSGNAARAVLAHELAHFSNGDIQLAGLARSLLKTTFLVAFFLLWIAVGMIALMLQVGAEVTSPGFWNELTRRTGLPGLDLTPLRELLRAQNPEVFVQLADPARAPAIAWYSISYNVSALLPFLISTAILYVFLWRKLMRVREFYADARAAETLASGGLDGVTAVVDAMNLIGTLKTVTVEEPAHRPRRILAAVRRYRDQAFSSGLLAFRPVDDLLKQALHDPIVAFGRPWQIAVWTGVAVLLLELMLRGSLTVSYINQPGPHLPLMTAWGVFALWLLPQVCSGVSGRRLAGMVLQMAAIFMLVKLSLNFADALLVGAAYLTGQLGPLGNVLNLWACTVVGGCGDVTPNFIGADFTWEQIVRWHIVTPIVYYLFFALPMLVAGLLLDARLKRWALTWYRHDRKVKRVFWVITGTLLALLLLVVAPIGNRLFFTWIYGEWSPATLAGMALGMAATLAVGGWFAASHRRLAGRCWQCDEPVPGPFALGLACVHCGARQHPWLLAPTAARADQRAGAHSAATARLAGESKPSPAALVDSS